MSDDPTVHQSIEQYWSTALADEEPGFVERQLLPVADRFPLVWQVVGVHVVYRNTGGSIIVSGLAYMALFALIPIFALLAIGISVWVEDPTAENRPWAGSSTRSQCSKTSPAQPSCAPTGRQPSAASSRSSASSGAPAASTST